MGAGGDKVILAIKLMSTTITCIEVFRRILMFYSSQTIDPTGIVYHQTSKQEYKPQFIRGAWFRWIRRALRARVVQLMLPNVVCSVLHQVVQHLKYGVFNTLFKIKQIP